MSIDETILVDATRWRELNEEYWELLDEVKDGEEREGSLVFLNQFLVRQISELQAELELERSRYTLGGVPPGYRPWGNVKLPPPPSAESGRFDGS